MNRLLRQNFKRFSQLDLTNRKKNFDEIINKVSNYLTGENQTTTQQQQQNLPLAKKFFDSTYNFPPDQLKGQENEKEDRPMTFTVAQDIEQFHETQKTISDLERIRMQNIDKVLGTNTYFHEIKEYQERLDSEHIMDRRIIKKELKTEDNYIDKLLDPDPQLERKAPKIRNFNKWAEELQQIKGYPVHEKIPVLRESPKGQLSDNYDYLKPLNSLYKSQDLQEKMDFQDNQNQIKKFLGFENLYTEISLIQDTRSADLLRIENQKRIDVHNSIPLYYDQFIYYKKDPKIISDNNVNLYRVKSEFFKDGIFDLERINQEKDEQLVFSKKELVQFLHKFKDDNRIFTLLENLQNENSQIEFTNICFSFDHKFCALIIDIFGDESELVTIIKNLETGQFFDQIITEIGDYIAFDKFENFYFLRKNELGRTHSILKSSFQGQSPQLIYKEEDPNYELTFIPQLNNDFILISCKSIGGNQHSEILYKETYKENSQFKLLIGRSHKMLNHVQVGSDAFYIVQYRQNEEKKKVKKVSFSIMKSDLIEQKFNQSTQIQNLNKVIEQIQETSKNNDAFSLVSNQIEHSQKSEIVYQGEPNSQDFFECQEQEKIIDLVVLKHYCVIQVQKENQNYFYFYNNRIQKFHTLKFQELLYSIELESIQQFESAFLRFLIKQPHQQSQIINYNIGLRDLLVAHTLSFSQFIPDNYKIEKIQIGDSDDSNGFHIIYNKQFLSSKSPFLIIAQFEEDQQDELQNELNFFNLSLMDRGFVIVLPQKNYNLKEQSINLKPLEIITEQIKSLDEICNFIKENDLTERIVGYAKGPLGCISLFNSFLNKRSNYGSLVLQNGVYDLIDLKGKQDLKGWQFMKKFYQEQYQELDQFQEILTLSPYYLPENDYSWSQILFVSENDNEIAYQSRKMIAKLRENDQNDEIYYYEFMSQDQDFEIKSYLSNYIINSAFKRILKPEK